ncbi:unnamed protein product [Lactuca saligna]|uniref:Bet v I/Major latex protein domain-containing protein n=1 Tax=Lactuca saligna TaxID=75948 RepID=A0AA36DZ22_LACSI|nr:unnamed protein product [Lactuca saligna]
MTLFNIDLEIPSTVAAPKLFKAYLDFNKIAPKVDPETYKSVDIIKGDGGPGTVNNITFADGLPFTNGKSKVDTIDDENLSLSYTIFEGDVLMGVSDSATHHIKFIPSADGGCTYKHTIVNKCIGDNKFTNDQVKLTKESFNKTFKAVEAHINANPNAY